MDGHTTSAIGGGSQSSVDADTGHCCGDWFAIHVMSCHGALEPSSAGPPSGRPSAERVAVTHTRTPMEWAPGEGGLRAPCMARRREVPGPS